MNPQGQDLFETVQLREWRSKLTAAVVALFVVEALTGLVIYFAPFSVSSQVSVLVHTLAGLAFVVPYAIYQYRHWQTNRERPFNQHKLLGYTSLVVLAVTTVTGVVLTYQAGWTSRISYNWDLVHLVGGLAATAIVLWHLGIIIWRHRRQDEGDRARRMRHAQWVFGRRNLWAAGLLLAVVIGWSLTQPAPAATREFPADYVLPFGDNPFAPSLAMTSTGGALEPSLLGDSDSCGATDCHVEIVEEWQPSAHRYSSMSPFFQGVQGAMAANNGPESTRYCGGCHDPIALFSGSKNLYSIDLSEHGRREGISCVVCHSIERTDVRGNANYTLAPQRRYLHESSDSAAASWVGRFLIRAYPRQHLSSWTRDLYKTPEYCGACHKQFIDEEINNVGWVQLQNQYDNWKQSRWHKPDDLDGSITCRECHMRLVDSADPASGDEVDYNRAQGDGKHRSHRFVGANQYLPTLLDLPGAEEHVRQVEEWLRGDTVIAEIEDKWTSGPAIPLQILAPDQVSPGERVSLQVVTVNNKAGHDFPTGPLDIIQAWVEVEVTDTAGNLIFESGTLDDAGFLQPQTTVFKAEAVDQFGNLIDKHNLWEMVGARFKRTLFPGYSDVATYAFFCPDQSLMARAGEVAEDELIAPSRLGPENIELTAPEGSGELIVRARLRYRKVDQYLINFLFPDQGLTAHITDMSEAVLRIPVVAAN